MARLKQCVLDRLPRYYHYIQSLHPGDDTTISSRQLGRIVGVDDTLVRHDMAAIGVRGRPRVGFRCNDILDSIRALLGFETATKAVIVGVGRLGGALVAYPGFRQFGLEIVGAFDSSPDRVGRRVGDLRIHPLSELHATAANGVRLGILTVPAEAAQEMADLLVQAGVPALWNFSPTQIHAPSHILVRNELMSVGLAEIFYFLRGRR